MSCLSTFLLAVGVVLYTFWLAAGVVCWGWKLPQRSGAVSCLDALSRTSARELEGAPVGLIVNLRMKQQAEKTNARNRTSVWEVEGAPAGFTVNSRMKQQVEKQTHQPNFGEGAGGSPCRIHCKFTYETASRKNKRTQSNFGERAGGSPCRIHSKFSCETANRKNKRT